MGESDPPLRAGPVHEPRFRAFLDAAPEALRPHAYDAVTWPTGVPRAPDPARLDALLASLGPGRDGVRAVLGWAGACSGSFRSGPADEALPDALLHRLGTLALLEAVPDDERDARVLTGLARHLGSHELSRAARSMPGRVSQALRDRLLAHVGATRPREDLAALEAAFAASRESPPRRYERFVHPDRALSLVVHAAPTWFALEPFALVALVDGALLPVLAHRPLTASVAVEGHHLHVVTFHDGTLRRLDARRPLAEPELRGEGFVRPVALAAHDGVVAVLEQRFENVPGVVHSVTHTRVTRVEPDGRKVELVARTGSAWDLALADDVAYWLEARGARVALVGGDGRAAPSDRAEFESGGEGFVRLAGHAGRLIVAVPRRRLLRAGVELLEVDPTTARTSALGFVAGRFEGLAVGPSGVALVVARGARLRVEWFGPEGRRAGFGLAAVPGPLVTPTVGADHVALAVGPRGYAFPVPTA